MRRACGVEYDERGAGGAVLFIHGALIADSFAPLMDEPALAGYRRIRFRRRGFGASEPPTEPASIEEHARDARSLLDELGAAPAHVVAHSGGGPIAVQLAVDAPDTVRSLVLIEPAFQNAAMAAVFYEMITPLIEMHRAGESAKAVHIWMRRGGSDWRDRHEAAIPGVGDQMTRDAGGTFEGDMIAMRAWDFDAVGVSRISQPVLYLVGSRSAAGVEPSTKLFRAAVPDTEFVVIDDADHSMPMTRATAVAEAIAPFLSSN